MKKYIFYDNGFTFERINKKAAAIAYNNNLSIVICPCNMNPFNSWYKPGITVNKKQDNEEFNSLVNAFEYYNCNNETGKYTAFYIPVKPVDAFTGEAITYETITTTKEYDYKFMEV